MYKITEELKTNGFSSGMLDYYIQRNNGRREFNTLDYFCIYIALDDAVFTIKGIDYEIKKGSLTYVGPGLDLLIASAACYPAGFTLQHFLPVFTKGRQMIRCF